MERLYSFLWWFIQVYQRFSIMFPRNHTCILVEILFGRTEFYFGRKNCHIHHGYELKKRRLFEDIHCISFSSHGITGYITTQKLYKYASPIKVNQSHIRKCKKVDIKCLPHFIHTTVRKIWNLKCWRWFYSYDKVLFQSEDRHLSN